MTSTDITDADDRSLIEAVQAGILEAFEPLVVRHLSHLHSFVSLRLPIPHLVDEITHETFVFAFHQLSNFKPGTGFRPWLRAIATNKICAEIERHCREERNRLAYAEQRELELALHEARHADTRELDVLHDCLTQVPENLRTLLTLKYHDGSSSLEIARRLNRTIAWVRTGLCRVRQQLRQCIEKKLNPRPS
jgi:RNA polymerase sigma-70 factor (ECF subfamily)